MRPLRKIVATKPAVAGLLIEVLECGHEQRQKSDIYGPTNAYRRRCRQCPRACRSCGSVSDQDVIAVYGLCAACVDMESEGLL